MCPLHRGRALRCWNSCRAFSRALFYFGLLVLVKSLRHQVSAVQSTDAQFSWQVTAPNAPSAVPL
jgi:hypothetical protein